MRILDYIESKVIDKNIDVLEIGPYHGILSDKLYNNEIKITAAESLDTAPIWKTARPYPVILSDYTNALNQKYWDIVIANNVIHHLHSPYHFWDMMMKSSKSVIVSGCVSPLVIQHVLKKDPEYDCGPHSRLIILPPKHHISYLEENGWIINEYRTDLTDIRDRSTWLINAVKKDVDNQ